MPKTLDTLVARTTTNLPELLSADQFEGLLFYVARQLHPCPITYQRSEHHNIRSPSGEKERISDHAGSAEFSGSISITDKLALEDPKAVPKLKMTTFNSIGDWDGEGFYINGIHFFTAPGYDLDEINPAELEAMDDVRREVNKYFTEHPTRP